ncbi:DUF998 domain-containing protein [Nocardioides sp.]|uniref:DUF998 domain-containing protein n=1 Tax=Nocardioides sp. TaxID=35761 RepID=UPI0035163FD2
MTSLDRPTRQVGAADPSAPAAPTGSWRRRLGGALDVATVVVLAVGGVLYADWMLQLVLPVSADLRHSFISELSAADQPFHGVFRAADIAGGVLMALGGAAAWARAREHAAVWIPLIALGIAVVVEAALPLATSITFDVGPAPQAGTAAWWARMSEPHGIASLVDSLSFLALLVTGGRALRRSGLGLGVRRVIAGIGLGAAALGFAQSAQAAMFLIVGHAFDLGLVQRTEVTLAAAWLTIVPALVLVRHRRTATALH